MVEIPKDELYNLYYTNELSLSDISKLYGVSRKPITRLMNSYGFKRRSYLESTIVKKNRIGDILYTPPTKDELRELYFVQGLGSTTIAEKYGVCGESIRKYLHRYFGDKVRTNSEAQSIRKKKEWGAESYRDDMISLMNSDEYKSKMSNSTKGYSNMTDAGKDINRVHAVKRWANPEWKDETVKRMRKASQNCPNKLEQVLIDYFKEQNLPYKFVGDGSVILYGLNPDFINCNGDKKIIELFGRAFHDESCTFKDHIPYNGTEEGRKAIFAELGYDTLIIWDNELNNMELIMNKIKEFDNKEMI